MFQNVYNACVKKVIVCLLFVRNCCGAKSTEQFLNFLSEDFSSHAVQPEVDSIVCQVEHLHSERNDSSFGYS